MQRRGADAGGEAAEIGRLAGQQEAALRTLIAGDSQPSLPAGELDLRTLLATESSALVIDAVQRTAAGDAVFTPGLAGLVLGEFRRLAATPVTAGQARPQLTDREAQILRMVATGLSYRQIAERLVLSHRTVQNHVQNTLSKLHLHNRVELTRYAIEHGLDSGG